MESGTFERLHPSRYLTFLFPNPCAPEDNLRVSVLDTPITPPQPGSNTAAILVPAGREQDWIFSTFEGHLQLLLSSSPHSFSRLVLIANDSDSGLCETAQVEGALVPLLLALSPKSSFQGGIPHVPLLSYDDGVVWSVVLDRAVGPVIGEMLVEDVEIEVAGKREWRRRLRFRRMPNLVQSQIRISTDGNLKIVSADLLLQPYLTPMISALWLLSPSLDDGGHSDLRPRALCVGVGGGCLPMFLESELGFDVVGVEADSVVLDIGRRHFGFVCGNSCDILIGDGIEVLQNFGDEEGQGNGSYDAIMVDVDSGDSTTGFMAPPAEFMQRTVVIGARAALKEKGALIINVFALNGDLYQELVSLLKEIFCEVYQIDVRNGENFVVVATSFPVAWPERRDAEDYSVKNTIKAHYDKFAEYMRKI